MKRKNFSEFPVKNNQSPRSFLKNRIQNVYSSYFEYPRSKFVRLAESRTLGNGSRASRAIDISWETGGKSAVATEIRSVYTLPARAVGWSNCIYFVEMLFHKHKNGNVRNYLLEIAYVSKARINKLTLSRVDF